MVLETIAVILLSLADFIKGAIIISIALFIFTLIGKFLKSKIDEKYELKWLQSSFVSTFIIMFLIIFSVYFGFYFLSIGNADLGYLPEDLQFDFALKLADGILFFIGVVIKKIFAVIVLTMIAVLFEFLGLIAMEKISEKYKIRNEYAKLYIPVLIVSAVFYLLSLYVTWFIPSLIYFIFFF